jgi:hypothetical protein
MEVKLIRTYRLPGSPHGNALPVGTQKHLKIECCGRNEKSLISEAIRLNTPALCSVREVCTRDKSKIWNNVFGDRSGKRVCVFSGTIGFNIPAKHNTNQAVFSGYNTAWDQPRTPRSLP